MSSTDRRGGWLVILACVIACPIHHRPAAAAEQGHRLAEGWEHYRGTLGSVWEVWRGEKASDNVVWTKVSLPHCFNARDAVDPDERYYQGPGWYRTRLESKNPFPRGRTLLHFDGAGQATTVFVHLAEVGGHLGGYDEWTIDITDAAARALADEILGLRRQGVLRVSHFLHLRAEVCSETLVEELDKFGPADAIGIVSLMDHTPGQRQFRDVTKLKDYVMGKHGYSLDEFHSHIAAQKALGDRMRDLHEAAAVAAAQRYGAVLALLYQAITQSE